MTSSHFPMDHGHEPHAGYCTHCGKRLRNSTMGIITTSRDANGVSCQTRHVFHGDRRACRVAAHEFREPFWTPPAWAGQMDLGNFGAALIGFDYIRWPWWMRWVPKSWLDGLHSEVAMKVGGAVERGQAWRGPRPNADA